MSDYEKLKKLIDDTDKLIEKDITSLDSEFKAWEMRIKQFISKNSGVNSIEMEEFNKILFWFGVWTSDIPEEKDYINNINSCRNGLKKAKAILETYLEEFNDEEKAEQHSEPQTPIDLPKIFIVHGHDGELKQSVARIIDKQNIEPIILSEQANAGLTIIEKIEKYSDVGCAICLFSADDIGRAKSEKEDKYCARQNVVFEAGYFIGKLGREHIIILADSGVEIPSDLAGVVYTNTQNWQIELLKELKSMGYNVDLNKLL